MMFLERLAECKIEQAIARGDFDDLPGKGRPIPDEVALDLIAPELRMGYRLLKNAGYVPEEVRLLREINEVSTLIRLAADVDGAARMRGRLRLLLERLACARGGQILVQEAYWRRVAEQLGGQKEGR
jgi:hypothetical protein